LTVRTLLEPGFETITQSLPPQMIVNESVKWWVGSAVAPEMIVAASANATAALSASFRTRDPLSLSCSGLSAACS
jgi:hypothetical protein